MRELTDTEKQELREHIEGKVDEFKKARVGQLIHETMGDLAAMVITEGLIKLAEIQSRK